MADVPVTLSLGSDGKAEIFEEAQPTYGKVRLSKVLGVTWIAYAAYIIARKPFSVVKIEVEKEVGLSPMMSGMVDTAFLTTYSFGQIFYSTLKSKYSSGTIITVGLCGAAACAMLFSMTSAPMAMVVLWGLNGIFESFGWPSCVSVVTPWLGSNERGRVMGVWGSCQAVGSLLANWLAATLLLWGWRWSYYGVVAVAVAVAVVVFTVLLEHPNRAGFVSPQQWAAGVRIADLTKATATTVDGEKLLEGQYSSAGKAADHQTLSTLQLAKLPSVFDLALSYFCQKLIRYSLLFWLPYYLTKELGYSSVQAGYISAAFDFGGIIGSMATGVFSDWYAGGKRKVGACFIYLQLGTAMLLLFSAMRDVMAGSKVATCFILGLVGFFLFGCDTLMTGATLQDLAEKLGVPQHAGSISGFVGGIGSIGAILQGTVTAYFATNYSWASVFYFLIFLSVVACLCMARPMILERRTAAR